MLICKRSDIAFVQIPKNGSKSIKRALEVNYGLDNSATAEDLGWTVAQFEQAYATGCEDYLPALGKNNLDHLPLAVCAQHLPKTFAAFRDANSFALIRAPRKRFISALLQRLAQFGGEKDLQVDDPIVREEAEHVCQWLGGRGLFFDKPYVHFARQVDYVDLAGERVVDAIFPIDRTDLAAAWVAQKAGGEFDIPHEHARRAPKHWARSVLPVARFLAQNVMPAAVRRAVYPIWRGSGLFENAGERYDTLMLGDEVEQFIEKYYAADFLLYEEACALAEKAAPISVKG